MEYREPLDYTDLYYIVRRKYVGKAPESELVGLEGKFYDLNITSLPAANTSKFLMFRPFKEKVKGLYSE
jgi:hypothetical protein